LIFPSKSSTISSRKNRAEVHVPRVLRLSSLSEGFPLAVRRITRHGPTALHTHDFTELVIVFAGRGVHYSNDEAYEVMAGDAFVVSKAHGYRDTEDLELVNVIFSPDRLALPLAEARKLPGYHAFFALEPRFRRQHRFRSCLHLTMEELSVVSGLTTGMETELRRRSPGFEYIATAMLMLLIGRLARSYEGMRAVESRPLIRLGTVLSHLEQHYAEQIRLKDLTRIAGMSPSGLLRAFRSITGQAPMAHLIRLRISRACDLLRTGELNITETAYRVGFSDSNYFARQFRRVMQCTPRDYCRRTRAAG
jgi:AraC-like DNA-binding protein/quercetin dioxygenase-like cupin family protein